MKHEGDLIIRKGDVTDYSLLKEVGDYLSINSDVKLDAPNLTTVGGSLYINSDAKLPNLTTVGGSLYINSDVKLDAPFLKDLKWKSIDGYLFVIESTKVKGDTTIYKGYNIQNVKDNVITKDECYVAEQGVYYAHGKTIKKAVEDVNFKAISEKLKKEPINKDTIIDMKYYRLITGACEMGVQSFIKGNGLKESYKASKLLPILEQSNAYGLSKFKELLTF